ncbi:MAG: nicotinate-nucleotide adenylyltransferase [Eubacteriales bacterium]|nr:nicotinate-nucleotide adenylyltransferase [Eubacteriales bacterium]
MKLGIMGGTFDPIHLGHLHVARAAIREAALNSVLFLPDGDPPHKDPLTPAALRYEMVRLAIAQDPAFWVSDMEILRKGRTYTVDTLLALKQQAPERELVYLIGSDTLFLFPTWRTAEKVARLCSMLVVMRQGDEEERVRAEQAILKDSHGLDSRLLHTRGLPISSSQVRQAVRQGQDLSGLVSPEVAAFIGRKGLYSF